MLKIDVGTNEKSQKDEKIPNLREVYVAADLGEVCRS